MTDLALLIIALSAVFTVLLKRVEGISLTEAIWQVWQTGTTVGYGNRPAETVIGRYLSMGFGLCQIALFGAVIGAIFDYRQAVRERRRTGQMRNPQRKGYVVFNFPGEAEFKALVQELRYVEVDVPICVVDDRIQELPATVAALTNIHFVRGSTLAHETYERAKIHEARVVIVFPTHRTRPESDGTTKTIVDLVERFVEDGTRTIHVLVDGNNNWMFDGTSSTGIMESLEVLALVQECQDMHTATMIQHLLLNTEGANPQTTSPRRVVGWSWGELQRYCIAAGERLSHPINPLAIIKNNVPDACPSPDARIDEGDALLVATVDRLDWDAFERCLIEVRSEESSR